MKKLKTRALNQIERKERGEGEMSASPRTIWTITALGKREVGRQVAELPLSRCLGFSSLQGGVGLVL